MTSILPKLFPRTKLCGCIILTILNMFMLFIVFMYLQMYDILPLTQTPPITLVTPRRTTRNQNIGNKSRQEIKRSFNPFPNVSILLWPRIPKTGGENMLNTLKQIIPKRYILITDAGSAYDENNINIDETYDIIPHEKFDKYWIEQISLNDYLLRIFEHWEHRATDPLRPMRRNSTLYICQYHLPFVPINNWRLGWYLNITAQQWKYISMIRDPISRIISSYYYIRGESGGWRGKKISNYYKNYIPKIMEMQNNYTIDECIKEYDKGNNICEFSTNYYVKWFCGGNTNMKICNHNKIRKNAYDLAIENIDTYFAWIGVLEYYKQSFFLFYKQFPLFFAMYQSIQAFDRAFSMVDNSLRIARKHKGYGLYKVPSNASIAILKRRNAWDLKLYDYVVRKYVVDADIYKVDHSFKRD